MTTQILECGAFNHNLSEDRPSANNYTI